ncbi:MAG: hypothetical protein BIFFINMI_01494 [Phycisphaerae bacterium]|nr:hypothetical protein [Phycisphaerae bacterium]
MTQMPENPVVSAILDGIKPNKSVICAVLAFLEAVFEDIESPKGPSSIDVVRQREVNRNGVVAQGRRAPKHLKRFGLPTENVSGDLSGRKTPWAGKLALGVVGLLQSQEFESADVAKKEQMLCTISEPFRSMLGSSLGPMRIARSGMSAAAVVEELLKQAESRGIVSAIAELLVGSKLEVCIDSRHGAAIAEQHKWDNGHDDPNALGDYRIENVAIEVTMVRGPDESHRTKANRITAEGTSQCWLIVRSDKIKTWQDYIAKAPSKYPKLVRCFGICEFVGQNVAETRWRSIDDASDPLRDVLEKLNELVFRLGRQSLPAAQVQLVD